MNGQTTYRYISNSNDWTRELTAAFGGGFLLATLLWLGLWYFQTRSAGVGGQQDLFFLAEMSPPFTLPETHEIAGGGAKRGGAFARGRPARAADQQSLYQEIGRASCRERV